jgi:hypothetical protein
MRSSARTERILGVQLPDIPDRLGKVSSKHPFHVGEGRPAAVSDEAGGDAGGDDGPAALECQLTLR